MKEKIGLTPIKDEYGFKTKICIQNTERFRDFIMDATDKLFQLYQLVESEHLEIKIEDNFNFTNWKVLEKEDEDFCFELGIAYIHVAQTKNSNNYIIWSSFVDGNNEIYTTIPVQYNDFFLDD